ncbi:MAG: T9SS type A sorting domain-containing protein [Bacteroidetes bacterium]|nr:T9SS type A sorting domain-containing protein [Bacteroidota bacterium]
MLKKLITLIILLLSGNILFAQYTFEQIISKPEDQVINHVIEDNEGNFVLVGRMHHIDTYYSGGYIIKIDSSGDVLQEKIIQQTDTNSCILFNIHCFADHYYILGSRTYIYPDTTYNLWYLKLNSNLDIENEKFLNIPDKRWFSYIKSIIDSDTNIVITGYTTREDTSGPSPIPYNNDPFFYKLSLSGDSLTSKFMSLPFKLTLSTDIIEKSVTTAYYAFGNDFADLPLTGQRFELSKNFDSLNIVEVPYFIYGYFSSVWLNDTSILICGQGGPETTPNYSLNVLSHTEDNIPVDYNYFKIEGNMRDHPAMYYGVSKNGDNVYVGGTSNFDYANPFFSTFDSWFHLIKINPDITAIWEYWYGGDAYYHLYSILATSDGGCLMVGNRYDNEAQAMERDIFIIKVNSDGILVWTQEIPIAYQQTTIYPNPGTSRLNIKTYGNDLDFELANMNGQVLIKQLINNKTNTINTEPLKPGMYFYRLINKKDKTIETGKWIKK